MNGARDQIADSNPGDAGDGTTAGVDFAAASAPPVGGEIEAILRGLGPDPDGLLRWLFPQLDDGDFEAIAAADYGIGFAENLAALRRWRAFGVEWAPLPDEPREVLEYVQWSEPDYPAAPPEPARTHAHLRRAFACAVLLRAAAGPAPAGDLAEAHATLIQLVGSAIVLGTAAQRLLLQFLAWRLLIPVQQEPNDRARPFFALAVLFLVVSLRLDRDGAKLVGLAGWILAEEAKIRAGAPNGPAYAQWLFGPTYAVTHDQTWREIGWRLLVEPPEPHPSAAEPALRDLAARLVLGYREAEYG